MKDLTVAVLQSNYLPWRGYFDIINDVDLFIFYDDVQYTKNDWRNRNVIKSRQGLQWLTVPVGQSISRLICEVELKDSRWQSTHWKTLSQVYSQAAHFERYREFFEETYLQRQWTNLSELNQYLIKRISGELLGIDTVFGDSRNYRLEGTRQERLLMLLQQVNAARYLSGPSGKQYLEAAEFEHQGVELIYKDYSGYPGYAQFGDEFDGQVSIVDVLFHCGARSSEFVYGFRQR